MKIPIKLGTPTCEGQYLWRCSSGTVEMITVVHYPEMFRYGSIVESYLGVPSYGGKDVSRLRGTFSEKLEYEI